MKRTIHAAGGIVWRPSPNGKSIEVLLVHRPGYKDWTFPKGKQDEGELIRTTARREVAEETNLFCQLGPQLGIVEYQTGGGSPKQVHMWAMPFARGKFKANSEVDKIQWVSAKKVTKHLTYERDRAFYEDLPDQWWQPKPQILLIRHAEAGNRRTWTGDDRTRPVSTEGRNQADQLRELHADSGIERILSSGHTRCTQTVQPLSTATGIEIEIHPALAEGADPRKTAELFASLAGARVAVCTHGDVITEVMTYLAKRGMKLKDPFEAKKGSVWTITLNPAGEARKAKYAPPPTIPAAVR